jgi:hypothetical protein
MAAWLLCIRCRGCTQAVVAPVGAGSGVAGWVVVLLGEVVWEVVGAGWADTWGLSLEPVDRRRSPHHMSQLACRAQLQGCRWCPLA